MKKFAAIIITILSVISCTNLDEILEQLRDHEERIQALEAQCRQLNSNVEAIQTILKALEQNDYITDITKITEAGIEIGYSITFAKGGTVNIYHGTNGNAPKISIRKASDGEYYWTSDGEWMTDDNGERIPAAYDCTNDYDYITPQFRVSGEDWYVSYDNGNTWTIFEVPTEEGSDNIMMEVDNSNKRYLIITFSNGETCYLKKMDSGSEIPSLSQSYRVELTPSYYCTVSNPGTEQLACAPGLVSYGNGNFAVAYLADDTNSVESESSRTIVCRLRDFNILSPEVGEMTDIAKAGQSIGNITISSSHPPYEPNILKINDKTLVILFNLRDQSGKYIYYSATYDTASKKITGYQPLSLDGEEWNPSTIASSYNASAANTISASGPSSSMVFTSKIITHEGYHYGFCGGICNGFSGILVRSTDGINWESYLTPQNYHDMAGVIECGFNILDDHIYLCMRDISSGIYHCSYRLSTKEQVHETVKLSGLTTSKPAVYIEDSSMYLIVNKETGDDHIVGRRNTALFYKVDPKSCSLTPVKEIYCRDGVAYHSVEKYNETNYWCFHTDARRINPYSQGRSNLAFLEIPEMSENGTGENTDATLTGLTLVSEPVKNYLKGSYFNPEGMILGAIYVDSNDYMTTRYVRIEDCSIEPDLNTPLTQTGLVSITYNDGNNSVSTSIVINVKESVSSLMIARKPYKSHYYAGEYFDPAGMEVLATFDDNTTALVNGYTCLPSGALSPDIHQITVTYGDITCTLEIEVDDYYQLSLGDYQEYYARGCIERASNEWRSAAGNMHYQIPLEDFKQFNTLEITANDSFKAHVALLSKRMVTSGPVAYASGWSEQLIIDPGEIQILSVPDDASWLYVIHTNAAGNSLLPSSIRFSIE